MKSTARHNNALGRALKKYYLENFDVDDCVSLLLDKRAETFPFERCIRLFQFQTWIWYHGEEGLAPRAAGRLAGAAILREIEDDCLSDRKVTLARLPMLPPYRKIFDALIAPDGGWSTLLSTEVRPGEFDRRIRARTKLAKIIADLIEYRLRATIHPPAGPDRSKITHAIFFNLWPNRLRTERTVFSEWARLKRTASFIYLIEKRGFPMEPPRVHDDAFCKNLKHPKISKVRLKKFFSEYAFVTATLSEERSYILPEHVTPAGFKVSPFSANELAVIGDYAEHHAELNDPKPSAVAHLEQ